MWFAFPEGTDAITVQLQEFHVEAKDEQGREYFRAPDHFAAIILDLPGFKTAKPPEGSPADLPLADPLRDGAIGQLTSQIDALKAENESLKAAHVTSRAEVVDLKEKLSAVETKLASLEATSTEFKPKK